MAAKNKKERAGRQGRGRKAAPAVAEAEVVEEVGGGMSLDDGIVVATTVALAFAVILVMLVNGAHS